MTELLQVTFWFSAALLAYAYAGFPLLVSAVGKLRGRSVQKRAIEPRVSLIIAAYNEEAAIADRIENALAMDYPREKLEIVVASDGSTDATEAIVARYEQQGVRLLSLARGGKIAALNAAVCCATGEILVFSDANSMYHPNALHALAANFADPQVGGVAGNTGYRLPEATESSGHGENLYWNYDTWLKQLESLTGSIVSAHGGMYAIRRELYRPLLDGAVTDDFAISTGVIEQGRRLVFEEQAIAYEATVARAEREFRRRVRLMTRGFRALWLRKALLNPFRYGFYSVILFSHKLLRRLLAVTLVLLFVSSVVLAGHAPVYVFAAVAQAAFYGVAILGWFLRKSTIGRQKVFFIPFFYCFANIAAVVALWKALRGERITIWRPQRHEARS